MCINNPYHAFPAVRTLRNNCFTSHPIWYITKIETLLFISHLISIWISQYDTIKYNNNFGLFSRGESTQSFITTLVPRLLYPYFGFKCKFYVEFNTLINSKFENCRRQNFWSFVYVSLAPKFPAPSYWCVAFIESVFLFHCFLQRNKKV